MAKTEEEKAAAKAAAKAEKDVEKEPEESGEKSEKVEEVLVSEQVGKAKLTRKGEVFSLYNGVGQLLQSGPEKELKKLYSEFPRFNK